MYTGRGRANAHVTPAHPYLISPFRFKICILIYQSIKQKKIKRKQIKTVNYLKSKNILPHFTLYFSKLLFLHRTKHIKVKPGLK